MVSVLAEEDVRIGRFGIEKIVWPKLPPSLSLASKHVKGWALSSRTVGDC